MSRQYAQKAHSTYVEPRRLRFLELPEVKRQFLAENLVYEQMLDSVEKAIQTNSQIAMGIYHAGCAEFAKVIGEIHAPETWHGSATDFDCSIARTCIRALFRDWSSEGALERDATHLPILDALQEEFGGVLDKNTIRVLVPGVGLGRLVYSISKLGYPVEGNDMSYHTLLTRMYLFANGTKGAPQALYPWALSFSNHINRKHQLQSVMIPDVHSTCQVRFVNTPNTNKTGHIVFGTGGFVESYGGPTFANTFAAVTTCYFIDTAPDFLDYVDTAWNCLRPGGIWINIGPLLWNSEENGPAGNGEGDVDEQESWKSRKSQLDDITPSMELTAEEVALVLQKRGFVIEQTSCNVGASSYVGNRFSLLQYKYNLAFWVARKQPRARI